MIDLMQFVQYGGCSAKIPQDKLMGIISKIAPITDENIMVDTSTSDDAGVYKISDDQALIVTTDFFPPICSDSFEFGQIAAANSLSDVYAMGGKPLLALNLNMFPSDLIPLEELGRIIEGGVSKVNEAGAFIMGGHTIKDSTPKYGLAVVGTCSPEQIITNSALEENKTLILTKPLGTGVVIAAKRMGMATQQQYQTVLESMKTLNKVACEVMLKYGVKAATDITGFGLIGHLDRMALSSGVSIQIDCASIPLFDGVETIISGGCVPATSMNNLRCVGENALFSKNVTIERKVVCCDAQTSGGILMAVDSDVAQDVILELHSRGCGEAAIIGSSMKSRARRLYFY